MKHLFEKLIISICNHSLKRPLVWLVIAIIITIPAVLQFSNVGLDTDLIRLLPEDSRAYKMKRQVDQIAHGSGGYFSILLEHKDKTKLTAAFNSTLAKVEKLNGIGNLEYTNPADFYKTYRYVLIPSDFLDRILDFFIRLEAKVNPMAEDLLSDDEEETKDKSAGKPGEKKAEDEETQEEKDKKDIKKMMRYLDLPKYHESEDGQVMAIKVFPQKGSTSLGKMKRLFTKLDKITVDISKEHGVWVGVGGSWRNSIDQYDFIIADLGRSGMITFILVLLSLIIGFRSIRVLPVVLIPLFLGLAWTLGSIPFLVGDLNTITSFLLLVTFGLGIDFSIHLVKRFQHELNKHPAPQALLETFRSTGTSIAVSGLTTALALFILAFSNFRGFSEFGIIGGYSLIMILLAMIFFLPAFCVVGVKLGLLKPNPKPRESRRKVPRTVLTMVILAVIAVSIALGGFGLTFNYDFSQMDVKVAQEKEIKDRFYKVYQSGRSPGALIIVNGLDKLDQLVPVLQARKDDEHSRIEKFHTLREMCPDEKEFGERLELIDEIKDTISGRWINRVEDKDYKKWIDDMKTWSPPDRGPRLEELPKDVRSRFSSKTHKDHYLVPVYIKGKKQKGRNAMAFTSELYGLETPEGTIGPFGETTVLADVLTIVTAEGPILVIVTFIAIFLLIWVNQGAFRQTLWIMLPLATGMVLTAGIMVAMGLTLNFFNIVVFPTLIGMGVDDGVHYYRRWLECGKNTAATQKELFGPLSLTSITTMFGYIGIAFSSHPGLQSIGILACIGLFATWFTSLYLLPGLLNLIKKPTETA